MPKPRAKRAPSRKSNGSVKKLIAEPVAIAKSTDYSQFVYQSLNLNEFIAVLITTRRGDILYSNQAAAQILGYPEGCPLKRNIVRHFKSIPDKPGEYEIEVNRYDGSIIPIRLSLSRQSVKRTVYWTYVIQDASEHRLVQQLKESEERFKILSESAPVLIWILDPNKRSIYLNSKWNEFDLVRHGDDAIWWSMKLHPDDEQQAIGRFAEAFTKRENVQLEYRALHKDGTYHWLLDCGVPRFLPNGTFLGYVGTSVDITVRKKLEQSLIRAGQDLELRIEQRTVQLANTNRRLEKEKLALKRAKLEAELANTAKSRFLATMSHEIRTPIGAIMGFAEMIRDKRIKGAERDECIDTIVRNGRHLLELINDILDLSKIEAGQLKISPEVVDLKQSIAQVVTLLEPKAREKQIQFSISYVTEVPLRISIDQTRLKQILINIIGNAIKFTPYGKVSLAVGCETVSDTSIKISIRVQDSGIGIAKEHQDQLFRPFVQLDSGYTRQYEGTGLGLALSRRFAKAMGGDVVLASSQPGKGSEFLITVEAIAANGFSRRSQLSNQRKKSPVESELFEKQILLVEDGEDNQILFSHFLESAGASVDIANNGYDGVKKTFHKKYDLILMDIQVPRLDGFAATKLLRRRGFRNPILALTAFAMREDQQQCFEAGCDACLTKPISGQDLLETVGKWVKRKDS